MLVFIRQLVSMRRRRYVAEGYDLDLSYIDKRLMAMSYPADGGLEVIYRNPMWQVQRFLEGKHPGVYKIFNLCSEQKYNPSYFGGRVERLPFDDHDVPPLALVRHLCINVQRWLDERSDNVVVIHCKAGKGRTGVMVCCYLVCTGLSAEEALALYAKQRTTDDRGVTIPSQRRYVHYWEQFLRPKMDTLAYDARSPFPTAMSLANPWAIMRNGGFEGTGPIETDSGVEKDASRQAAGLERSGAAERALGKTSSEVESEAGSVGESIRFSHAEDVVASRSSTADLLTKRVLEDVPSRVERQLRRIRLYGVAAPGAGGPETLDLIWSTFGEPDETFYRKRVMCFRGHCVRVPRSGCNKDLNENSKSSLLWMLRPSSTMPLYQLTTKSVFDSLPGSKSVPPNMLLTDGRHAQQTRNKSSMRGSPLGRESREDLVNPGTAAEESNGGPAAPIGDVTIADMETGGEGEGSTCDLGGRGKPPAPPKRSISRRGKSSRGQNSPARFSFSFRRRGPNGEAGSLGVESPISKQGKQGMSPRSPSLANSKSWSTDTKPTGRSSNMGNGTSGEDKNQMGSEGRAAAVDLPPHPQHEGLLSGPEGLSLSQTFSDAGTEDMGGSGLVGGRILQMETERPIDPNYPPLEHTFLPPKTVGGDVLLRLYSGSTSCFKVCFNTAFISKGMLSLKLDELDKVESRFERLCNPDAFNLEIIFGQDCEAVPNSGLLSPIQ